MPSVLIQLADAVKTMLNQASAQGLFSKQFAAERIYDAMRPLEEMETMRVDVVLGDRKQVPLDRSRQQNTLRVEICIRQIVTEEAGSAAEKAKLDALVSFMEEIDQYTSLPGHRRPPAFTAAGWQGSELIYPFLPRQLRESRQFISLLRLTYLAVTT